MKKRLVIALSENHTLPGLVEEAGRFAQVVIATNHVEAMQELRHAEGLLLWDMESTVDIKLAPKLEWIHVPGIGVDRVISQDVLNSEVAVTNTRGIFEHPIAEYVLGMMLLVTKEFLKTYDWQRLSSWNCRPTSSLRDQDAVLIGPGAIGREIFKILTAVGVKVSPVGRRAVSGDPLFGYVHSTDELKDLLPSADTVILSMPLTEATAGFMNERRLAQMKHGSCLINIGRGGLVDEGALLKALKDGRVGTAALDVFAVEPLPQHHPFWTMDQVIVSPHMSGELFGWEKRAFEQFLGNLERWVNGEPLQNVVDKVARAV